MGRLTNIDLEMSILGGLLQFDDLADEISELTENDFSFSESQKLFNVIKSTFSTHNKVDIALAGARLQEENLLTFAVACTQDFILRIFLLKKRFLNLQQGN